MKKETQFSFICANDALSYALTALVIVIGAVVFSVMMKRTLNLIGKRIEIIPQYIKIIRQYIEND